MRKPIIAGNWKMNKTLEEAISLAQQLDIALTKTSKVDILLCPPFVYLQALVETLSNSNITVGAQNVYSQLSGAFTGEISPSMLTSIGCTSVIIGHSERRTIFNETNNALNKKILLALSNGLQVIYCVGESLEERESNNTLSVITEQLNDGLNGVSVTPDGDQLIIAYEPVWAIGTGKVATPEQAQYVHHFIRKQLALIWNKDTANNTRIQYGGSVKPSNFDAIIEQPDIDGALVGGASLIAKDFIDIVTYTI